MRPKVSVIIPAFNAENYIETAVASALNQTEGDLQILVVDDGSSDSTFERVRSMGDVRIKGVRQDRNRGPSSARNRALSMATGEWIAFLDADDWYVPSRLGTLLRVAADWKADLVADDMYRGEDPSDPPQRTIFSRRGLGSPEVIDAARFLALDIGLQPIIRHDLIRQHSIAFDERLRNGEDTLFMLECLLAGGRCVLWPEPLYFYRVQSGSLTSRKIEAMEQRQLVTKELLARESVGREPIIRNLLQKRLADAKAGMLYHQIANHLRRGSWWQAFSTSICKPELLSVLFKIVPRAIVYRLQASVPMKPGGRK